MLGLDGLAVAYSLAVLHRRGDPRSMLPVVVLTSLGWLAVLHGGLQAAVFPPDISGPAFLALVFGFVGLVGGLLWLPPARAIMARATQSQLLQLQGIRIYFGAGFLMLVAVGDLPFTFGLIDGLTHITAGVLGLFAALRQRGRGARVWSWLANVMGLLDILVVASTIALVLLPDITPHHRMMYAVFFPAPFWFWFHIVSMTKAVRAR